MASNRKMTSLRTRVFARDGYACRFCGRSSANGEGLQLSHVVPRCEGGANRAENLITVCAECNEQAYRDYLAEVIGTRRDYFGGFITNMEVIARLAKLPVDDPDLDDAYANMLFVSVVTAVETYLSDTFIGTVVADKRLVQRLVETDPEFSKRKFELSEIYRRMEQLEVDVKNYLLDIVYHNLGKVKNLYGAVLDIEFPEDFSDLARAVERRHDLVHRNGKTKAGLWVHTTRDDVISLLQIARAFVLFIDLQLRKMGKTGGG